MPFSTWSATGSRCSASALGCSGCSRAAKRRLNARGLGVLGGRCRRLSVAPGEGRLKIPHVGWNSLEPRLDAGIIEGVPAGAQVYFTHSYIAPVTGDTVAATEHGETIRVGRSARPDCRRPVSPGEVGRRRVAHSAELAGAGRLRPRSPRIFVCFRNASSPASTSATATSSRASTSKACGARAIPPSWRDAITTKGSTSSSSST